ESPAGIRKASRIEGDENHYRVARVIRNACAPCRTARPARMIGFGGASGIHRQPERYPGVTPSGKGRRGVGGSTGRTTSCIVPWILPRQSQACYTVLRGN